MQSIRNKVLLIGNVGQDPEIKEMKSGKMARFSMATNEVYKNAQGEKQTETNWHNLVAWGRTAEIVEQYVKKGDELAIEGRLVSRNYEDKDGVKRYITEVVLNEVVLLSQPATQQASTK
ncbi:MAG: single-stranded DNA-binding protein [Chitinophagales bacterium]|jgi:single-strand DNA-binding protein|nr:single-stranded DNA-binding protein [Chitinophagales bacterium]